MSFPPNGMPPVEFRDTFPNDPRWADNWSFAHIGLPSVWDISTGGQTANGDEIVVAILDSGFDLSHEDLQGNLWENLPEVNGVDGEDDDGNGLVDDFHGWNFEMDINDVYPNNSNGHGTSVAGIIGGKGNNSIGVSGVNWNVKMMFFKVKEKSDVVSAFNYIIEKRELYKNANGGKGAFVVATNASFGIDRSPCENSPAWAAMYDLLGQAGVLNVAATANENWDVDELGDMPTSCPNDFLVTVTAADRKDERLYNAAFGPTTIDLAAPGDTIMTTTLNQGYFRGFGSTSAATPHVTGTVALLYSLPCIDLRDLAMTDPPAAALLVKDALLQNVDIAPSLQGKTVSGGRLNAYESMKHIHAWCIGLEEDRKAEQVKEVYLSRREVVHIYPNPAKDMVTVHFAALDFDVPVKFRVLNALGQEMYFPENELARPFEKQQFDIDVSDWASGLYVVNILDNTQKIALPFLKL